VGIAVELTQIGRGLGLEAARIGEHTINENVIIDQVLLDAGFDCKIGRSTAIVSKREMKRRRPTTPRSPEFSWLFSHGCVFAVTRSASCYAGAKQFRLRAE
jgi:hypothetical protein